VLLRQVTEDLADVVDARLADVVIAYEPVWAIGTGRTATPEQATEAIGQIRRLVAGRSAEAAERIRILYGGSVKPANAGELMASEEIDGALVGGAALDPEDFVAIVEAARP
ncbi:MAG: triose-phosphate isomerase, partial [Solirubrobacterales bacterium]